MNNINKYYDNTRNTLPNINVREFIEVEKKTGNAIDIGCGAGRDTVFLIKKGWNVLAIDREDTESIIKENLNEEETSRLKFSKQDFENIVLEDNDLIVANFSLPFCNKKYFYNMWDKIVNSLRKDGYFVGNFLGLNDSWDTIKEQMIFLSKRQVKELLDKFEIIKFEEIEKDGKTALGKIKHWHIYNVIGKIKNNLSK